MGIEKVLEEREKGGGGVERGRDNERERNRDEG